MKSKKIVNICLIIACIFLYLVASQIAELVIDALELPITRDYWMTIPEMIAAGVSALVFVIVSRNRIVVEFFVEAVNELSKVTYPTKKESGQSAVVVIVLVAIATIVLALFDSIWSYVTQIILTR